MTQEMTELTSDCALDAKQGKSFDVSQHGLRDCRVGSRSGGAGRGLLRFLAPEIGSNPPSELTIVSGSICALRRLVGRDVTTIASGEACLPTAEQAPTAALGRNPAAGLGSQFAGSITGLGLDRKAEIMRAGLLAIPGCMDASRPRVIRG
jgi:hypothetical protein